MKEKGIEGFDEDDPKVKMYRRGYVRETSNLGLYTTIAVSVVFLGFWAYKRRS
jgi:hypothetical protein